MRRNTIAISVLATILGIATLIISVGFGWTAVGAYVENYFGWGVKEHKEEGTITYFSSRYETWEDTLLASKDIAIQTQAQGTVLLENNGALPLKETERKVSVFGTGSVNLAYGGTGSGEGNGGASNVDLYTALESVGFRYNTTLKSFYEQKYKQGYRRGEGTDMNGAYYGRKGLRNYGYSINEVERSAYGEVRASYEEFDDLAIIVISRSGGEGQDLPTSMKEFYEGDDKHYLELTDEEIDLLKEVKDADFDKTIVLLNTLNAFGVGFLKSSEYEIDAALWIGGPGQYGMEAVTQILTGELAPEGRLPDTYAYDLLSAPAMQNYGDNRYVEDGKVTTAAYVAYAEGIYSGYRYYETRYADYVLGQGNAGEFIYENEVVYPFGYGIGYTDFEWGTPVYEEQDGKITISVEVVNCGERAGREVVQLYAHKPYLANDKKIGVEKSAVDLVGYSKTSVIEVGKSEIVHIEIDKSQLATYDAYEKKTYRMDAGEYYLIPAKNAHEAVDAVLYGVETALLYEQMEDIIFSESHTRYEITNRFETESYTSKPTDMAVLSRSDWQKTWPKVYGDGGVAGKATKTITKTIKNEIINTDETAHLGKNSDEVDYIYNTSTGKIDVIEIDKAITNSGEGINFIDMVDEDGNVLDYNDEKWMKLVQCMTERELYVLLSSGFGKSEEVKSINKRKTITSDSPMGLHCGTLFPCYPIQAATWSVDIAASIGECIAEEGLWNDIRGWYAPTCNLHRTPFGGRNYEYYSEDGVLAGKYAAAVVRAVQSNGLYVHLKHFALNEQDTNRGDRGNFKNFDPYNGLCTYANEQSIREIYLKAFQLAVEEGGSHGVMTSYNRIGNTWTGGHYGLVTEVLRNEWGMQGIALTDYAGTFGYTYMNMNQGLRAGNNQWLHPSKAFPIDDKKSDAAIYYMQKAAKNILFAEVNSSRINNQRYLDGTSVTVKLVIPPWKWISASIYGAIAIGCLVSMIWLAKGMRRVDTKITSKKGSMSNVVV